MASVLFGKKTLGIGENHECVFIMKRKFKRSWSTIIPILIKLTTTCQLKPLNTKKMSTYADGNLGPGLLGTGKTCDWV